MIHDITAKAGRYKKRLRVGRGEGGGRGKQSGRGNKGAGSRSGTTRRAAFEGGQMPLFRRLRKYGFSNAKFRTEFWTVNLGQILTHPSFKNGGTIEKRPVETGAKSLGKIEIRKGLTDEDVIIVDAATQKDNGP